MRETEQNMPRKFIQLLAHLIFIVNRMAIPTLANFDDTLNNLTNIDYYGPAEETQHTYCKIATEELQATANATITRELKGVCTSKELKKATNTILREIQTLKDALIIQVASTTKFNMASSKNALSSRNKRKNILNNFDILRNLNGVGLERMEPENFKKHVENIDKNEKYSYYWTITDANENLHDGASLISPEINYEGASFHLRVFISDYIATIKLEEILDKIQVDRHGKHNTHYTDDQIVYILFVLNMNNSKRDLRLDSSNNYSVSLRRLRQFKNDSDAMVIKLIMY